MLDLDANSQSLTDGILCISIFVVVFFFCDHVFLVGNFLFFFVGQFRPQKYDYMYSM